MSMKMNTAMRFVMMRARNEQAYVEMDKIWPEHVFCGILKLSELTPNEVAPESSHKEQIAADIEGVRTMLNKRGLNSQAARALIRFALKTQVPDAEKSDPAASAATEKLDERALQIAENEAADALTAVHYLEAIIEAPTMLIAGLLSEEPEGGGEGNENERTDADEELTPAERLAKLPALSDRVRGLRDLLLEKVFGQDHAVHQFAECIFAAEVLADADRKRVRPRAIFVFTGPPGVGKTYLAEQGGEAIGLPFKRFDMSGFSDHQAHTNLVGYAPSYKDAKSGMLTDFVRKNPHSILLFDEVEKAHLNTIQLFLQILDAGRLHDDFLDKDIPFSDTIIIFTTNAGKQLYEDAAKTNAAAVSRKTILNALETDTDPRTGSPYFPAAICSRLATGNAILFNHLKAHDLEKICAKELERSTGLFENSYGLTAGFDKEVATMMLFSEGGLADARTLRARTEQFFKSELYKLSALYSGEAFAETLAGLDELRFTVDLDNAPTEALSLFQNPDKPGVLLFTDALTAARIEDAVSGECAVWQAQSATEAFKLIGEKDIGAVLLDVAFKHDVEETSETFSIAADPEATVLDMEFASSAMAQASDDKGTAFAFDNVPMAAEALRSGRAFFRSLLERAPEMPVYLLETPRLTIDKELLMAFVRAGARGKLIAPGRETGAFAEELYGILKRLFLQKAATDLAKERKLLSFESAPQLSKNKKQALIRLRDLSLKRNVNADDTGEVLADAEKPSTSFGDVIGANSAKDELTFFVDYLKNTKKFMAQGLKPPKGVLLYGPPGTGKTLIARAMAGESDVAFIPAAASEFVTKWQGSGPEAVRNLFSLARKYAPSILFIDEIDAIGRKRGGSGTAHGEEMALNALLTEMDGFKVDPKRPVFVLAATNFDIEDGRSGIGVLDPALVRRFDRTILVDMPTKEDRLRFLKMMLSKNKTNKVTDQLLEQLSGRSSGLSLANLANVLELATRTAVKRGEPLGDAILEEAFETSRHGERKDWGEAYMERVARHEAGHAFLCHAAGRTPAYLTIIARGGHGGYMEHDISEDSPLKTKEELLGRLRTALGGRAAELVYYGEKDGVSTGAAGDLESATGIVRAMICSYGMDEEIGFASLGEREATQGPLAEKIAARISQVIREELDETVKVLSEERTRVDRLVEALMEKNRLDRTEMEQLLS